MREFPSVCASTSFIINIDALYTRSDTYVSEVRIRRSLSGADVSLAEKFTERTCNKKKTNHRVNQRERERERERGGARSRNSIVWK